MPASFLHYDYSESIECLDYFWSYRSEIHRWTSASGRWTSASGRWTSVIGISMRSCQSWWCHENPFMGTQHWIEGTVTFDINSLQWRHNGHDGISNHQPHDCLLNCLFRRRSKKTSKLHVTGICAGNSPVTDEFPAQMASNTENVSIGWCHHVLHIFEMDIS